MCIRDSGYYSSEGEAGRLAESMADLFSLLVNCICWHDCCDTKQYVDSKTLEEYGQRQRNCNLEDMDMDSLRRVSDALGIPTDEPLAPVLERFRKATQREPLYPVSYTHLDVYKRQGQAARPCLEQRYGRRSGLPASSIYRKEPSECDLLSEGRAG